MSINRKRIREALMSEGYSPTHCGVCDRRLEPEPGGLFRRRKRWRYYPSVIEHDHWNGFCRGFVCQGCNFAIAKWSLSDVLWHFRVTPGNTEGATWRRKQEKTWQLASNTIRKVRLSESALKSFIARDRAMPERVRAFVSQHSSVKYE